MRFSFLVLMAVALSATVARAEMKWTASSRPYLEARSTDSESDASFRALCRSPAAIELRVGAHEGVGKGKGDAVTLRLSSNGHQAVLHGASRRSDDYEMTSGTELVTEIKPSDAVFTLLGSGKDVTITGSLAKPVTWRAENMADAVKSFLTACQGP